MYKHILIATDGSDPSNKAIQQGVALAKAMQARVTGITVTTPYPIFAMEADVHTPEATASEAYKARSRLPSVRNAAPRFAGFALLWPISLDAAQQFFFQPSAALAELLNLHCVTLEELGDIAVFVTKRGEAGVCRH
jgi:nucleotide-binding universal stress UspA family protein